MNRHICELCLGREEYTVEKSALSLLLSQHARCKEELERRSTAISRLQLPLDARIAPSRYDHQTLVSVRPRNLRLFGALQGFVHGLCLYIQVKCERAGKINLRAAMPTTHTHQVGILSHGTHASSASVEK
jgi:hypothetical protein